MAQKAEIQYVFISGPSDTEKEKRYIKELIESLNRTLCPSLGLYLEPIIGPSHASAGMSRPQSRINPFVEKCDIFIGVYKRKYGTNTGLFDSGSREEFVIASRRKKKNRRKPEILLFFHKFNRIRLKRADTELGRLSNFKDQLKKHVLYKTYSNQIDLLCEVNAQLIQSLLLIKKKKRIKRRKKIQRRMTK